MEVTRKILYHLTRSWTIMFILVSTAYEAQENVCDKIADNIEAEAKKEHYLAMDSLFNLYKASATCRADVYNYKRVLETVKEQRLADGYRIEEANVLESRMDSLNEITSGNVTAGRKDTTYYHPFRLGVLGSVSGSNFGYGVTWAYGLTAGWHKERVNSQGRNTGWGVDMAFSYQRLPFTIDYTDNRINNSYSADGVILKTRGFHYFYGFSALVAWDIPRSEDFKLSAGLVGGLEFQKQRTTYIKNYYHEYNYRDSIVPQTNLHYLNFNADEKNNLYTNSFFKDNLLMKFVFGLNINWKVADWLLITSFPYASLSLTKMKLNEESYSKHVNSAGLKISASFLLGRKELQRRPYESQKIYK